MWSVVLVVAIGCSNWETYVGDANPIEVGPLLHHVNFAEFAQSAYDAELVRASPVQLETFAPRDFEKWSSTLTID